MNVTIILVNYNGWEDTIECLSSLEKVTYDDFQVIVVDNASTDDSFKRIDRFLNKLDIKVTLIQADKNIGFAGGNNLGIRYAQALKSDYYLMLNNDTLVTNNFLDELIKPFSDKSVGATIGKIYYASSPNKIWYAGGSINSSYLKPAHYCFNCLEEQHKTEYKKVSFATGCCICCSKECLHEVGLWDETFFLYEEDIDFSLRIIKCGYSIVYNSDSIIYHKVSASTSKIGGLSQIYQVRNRLILIKRNLIGAKRVKAHIYTFLLFILRIVKREYSVSYVLKGYRTFTDGEYGRISKEEL